MDPERFRRVQRIFMDALQVSPSEQERFVESACAGDQELRAEVLSLLDADRVPQSAGEFVDVESELCRSEPAQDGDGAPAAPEPETLAGYRIIRKLGSGGMGVVYEAEQEQPRRRVALKLIRPDVATPSLRRRFELESEVLGHLQHPGIASIHEAGATASGRLYFAMELVEGRPLTDHARVAGLDTRARLELVVRVCDAVEHAHQRGVIHRDLKPANILVDGSGQPRVLDFGVARLVEPDAGAVTFHTQENQVIGTLPYMSPEQATGKPAAVDSRTDVYSLGAILHELLVGRPPLDVDGKPLYEALRTIRDDEPARLGTVDRALRGDLETIVAKALAKEKEHRYPTASVLSADIRHFLRDEPITARDESALYSLVRFARRNRGLVAGIIATVVAMAIGTVVSVQQALVARRQSELAQAQTRRAVFETRRARLAAASASIRIDDAIAAQEQLDLIAARDRGWEWRYWRSRIDRCAAVFQSDEPFLAAVFETSGERVITVTPGGRLAWWDARLATELRATDLDVESLSSVCFSNDRTRFAAATGPGRRSIVLFETASGARKAAIDDLPAPCDSVAMSDDGRWVVGASMERAAWIWDTGKDRPRAVDAKDLAGATSRRCIVFRPDGKTVTLTADSGWFGVFGLEDGTRLSARDEEIYTVSAGAYSPDAVLAALGEQSNKVFVIEAQTGAPVATLLGHTRYVRDVCFAPSGKELASAGDRTIRVWDLSSASAGGSRARVLTGHEAVVTGVAYSPDGSLLVSTSSDGTARVWDLEIDQELDPDLALMRVPVAHARSLALTADGRFLVAGNWQRSIQIWRADTGDLVTTRPASASADAEDRIRCVDVSPGAIDENASVLTAHASGWLCLWRLLDGELVAKAPCPGASNLSIAAAFHPDGSRVVSISGDASVRVFDVPKLEQRAVRVEAEAETRSLDVTRDGRLVAGSFDATVRLYEFDGLVPLKTLEAHAATVFAVTFDADGTRVASGDSDGVIIVWEVASGEPLVRIEAHQRAIGGLSFSPDGGQLASASYDSNVRLWELANGAEVARLRGHAGRVYTVEFSRDGQTLFSSATDGVIRRWDARPVHTVWLARNRRRRLLEDVTPIVSALFETHGTAAAVLESLRRDAGLDGERLRVAVEVIQARATADRR